MLTQTVRLAKGTTVTATLGNKGTVNGANLDPTAWCPKTCVHSNNTGYVCNNLPKNTIDHYELSCTLPRVVSHVPTVDSSTLPYNSKTVARFTISLCDTNSLFMSRGVINATAYKAVGARNYTNVSLVLRDDIVLFYKRD